jgi:hypothetical protein
VGVGCGVKVAGVPRVVAGGIGGKGAGWAVAVGMGVGANAGVDVFVVGLLCEAVAAVRVGIVGEGVVAGVGARVDATLGGGGTVAWVEGARLQVFFAPEEEPRWWVTGVCCGTG